MSDSAPPPPRTLAEKIWWDHRIAEMDGGTTLVLIDRILLHERTGGVALKSLSAANRSVMVPDQVFATMDHIVDTFPGRTDKTLMPTGTAFLIATREAAHEHGITLFDLGDPRQGIVHVTSPEQGIVLPGVTLVCPDSHTCTQGAFGALAWGIGSTEAEHALATMTLRIARPLDMRITIDGVLPSGVTAKDLALHIVGRLGSGGAKGHIVEFAGSAVRALDMEARMTLCNLATELAAFGAVVAPDQITFAYLQGRTYAPSGAGWDVALGYWQTLNSDPGAAFAAEHHIDAADVAPMVTWGTSPQHAAPIGAPVPRFDELGVRDSQDSYDRALDYMALAPGGDLTALPIDAAFIGSCTNSRLSDLRRAAAILRGRKVAPGVRAICVPGSTEVKRQAEAEGLDIVFREAGFEWREAGCSMCFFAGGESFGAQERVISSTNRNFESRQGPGTRTHLASPETVAASAIAGHIADPRRLEPIQ
ncbi:3-isopropylmalate dehydratase large subunit [Sphingobium boeckii]|uniref:3-isopropylmalate dehydratase n=1 Tax=Sphingobium boeckii TaxID=1082345 RepID=A0A7W9EFB3_9SPHN|nr:3-isopropylmalate dehydratase large subunit [Sphingobium boeckii]MBB5686899.1 3-isopropylmalate/(R)-2-methylmalate dehydratase large subunit [Sphingobium boeckii]